MPSRRWMLLALVVLVPPASAAARHVGPSPARVVRALYRWHFAHEMAFRADTAREKAPWLAPDLATACLSYLNAPALGDEVPEIDGDPFTDSQEYPRSFIVGQAAVDGSTARVPVTLEWPDRHRDVDVALELVRDHWLVTDVRYENGESLRGLLHSAR